MKIIINIGNTEIHSSTKELAEVNETPDGVVFDFKDGLSVLYTNPYMESASKQIIKNTADHLVNHMEENTKNKLVIDPTNKKAPARIEAP